MISVQIKKLCLKGVGVVQKKLLFCGLLCLLMLSGCGKKELLEEKLDAAVIDKVVVTMAMGNPAYGADCKIITDPKEVQDFVFLFNHAEVEGKSCCVPLVGNYQGYVRNNPIAQLVQRFTRNV